MTLVFNPSWWEASERAAWELNRHARRVADGRHREVVLASPRCVGPGFSPRPLTVAERTIGRHLYVNQKINPASWTAGDVRRMAQEINDYAPLALEGDPAYLAAFARRIAELGIEVCQPRLIFLTYSYPSRIYLRQIRGCFHRPAGQFLRLDRDGPRLHGMRSRAPAPEQRALPRRFSALAAPPRRPAARAHAGHGVPQSLVRPSCASISATWPVWTTAAPAPAAASQGLTLAAIEGRVADVTFDREGNAVTVDDLDAVLAEIPGLNGWQLDLPRPGSLAAADIGRAGGDARARRHCPRAAQELVRRAEPRSKSTVAKALRHELSGKIRFTRTAFPVDLATLWQEQEVNSESADIFLIAGGRESRSRGGDPLLAGIFSLHRPGTARAWPMSAPPATTTAFFSCGSPPC